MFKKWIPWKFIIRKIAEGKGFLDPIAVIAKLQKFAQPSEVAAPVELIRLSMILQARGLVNAQAIQHNLDWVWPFWVEKQFNPHDASFIPRAFSVTHINLTHRNWTALGIPETSEYALVDPHGLLTPAYDGWSIDAWIIDPEGEDLIPSRLNHEKVNQKMIVEGNLKVRTLSEQDTMSLESVAQSFGEIKSAVTQLHLKVSADKPKWLAVSIRPYNPEGVSSIESLEINDNMDVWTVNKKQFVYFDKVPHMAYLSEYHQGDVYGQIKQFKKSGKLDDCKNLEIHCDVGMASGVAIYPFNGNLELKVHIPAVTKKSENFNSAELEKTAVEKWYQKIKQCSLLELGDRKYQYLYDTALRSLILHSPEGSVFPGPYTYRHFWFRDAAIIMNAMLGVGLFDKVEEIIDSFEEKQTLTGHFRSQDGEWDSNGQVLWIVKRFCEITNRKPKDSWRNSLERGAKWICRKRLKHEKNVLHEGLYPAGFSAEHLGPNDYYYWDDFWGVEGLRSASYLMRKYGDDELAKAYLLEAGQFLGDVEKSLAGVREKMGTWAMPSSPYRRLDSACIGSIVVGYPLRLWEADDKRLIETVNFLTKNFLVHNGFFHDMSHSGINPYLTLYIAQIYLRAGDTRFISLMQSIADLASGTGQWPEAINPRTLGGCMGDGQHVWASAEWVLMLKNCFILEDNEELVLCKGLQDSWFLNEKIITFGPIHTKFGKISLTCQKKDGDLLVSYTAEWHQACPLIKIDAPNYKAQKFPEESCEILLKRNS